jgi:hypothetical protein
MGALYDWSGTLSTDRRNHAVLSLQPDHSTQVAILDVQVPLKGAPILDRIGNTHSGPNSYLWLVKCGYSMLTLIAPLWIAQTTRATRPSKFSASLNLYFTEAQPKQPLEGQ